MAEWWADKSLMIEAIAVVVLGITFALLPIWV
jgi:hypothetical protein